MKPSGQVDKVMNVVKVMGPYRYCLDGVLKLEYKKRVFIWWQHFPVLNMFSAFRR